jgi:O-antigen/teichoic acid export membrane protein
MKRPHARLITGEHVRRLLALGALVSLAQVADFLYAPTDYILINRLISPRAVAYYAPAVQIDAALLLVVGAISTVLLPKAAVAHTAGDHAALRRYFVRGTLVSGGLLLLAGACVYFLSPWIFRLWLGDALPQTQAILPLVLVHTVVGGSSGVGRAILLGMGKVKPFAIAALVAGVANVVLSYTFVKVFGLGLNGIVYGTIVAVVGRCVLWQPWYVLRALWRESQAAKMPREATLASAVPPQEPL